MSTKDKSRKRRDMIRLATPADQSAEDKTIIRAMEEWVSSANAMYESRGKDLRYQVDHIHSLALGGRHEPDNLQVITEEANKKKGDGDAGAKRHKDAIKLDRILNWYNNLRGLKNVDGTVVKGVSGNASGRPKAAQKISVEVDEDVLRWLDELASTYDGSDESKRFVTARINLLKKSNSMDVISKGINELQPLFAARKKDEDKDPTEVIVHVVPHNTTMKEVLDAIKKKNTI